MTDTLHLYFKMRFNQGQIKDFIKVVLEGKGYVVDKFEFKDDELIADLHIDPKFHSELHKLKKQLEESKEQIERLKSMLVSYEYNNGFELREPCQDSKDIEASGILDVFTMQEMRDKND